MYMQHLAINRTGIYRKATLNGRDHYVVPMSLIVPGVLSGSKGALHYPPDEISKNYDAWNGMPLVVNHPMHNGRPISARSAAVIDSHGIGTVLNARINKHGKLVAEGWFDIEKANTVDPRIISSIERGEQIELSTGLFTDNIPVKNGENAHHNGKKYTHIARNYRPDHLAILPDELGACSIKDGCGVGVVNASSMRNDSGVLLPKKEKCKACQAIGKGCKCSPVENKVKKACPDCGKPLSECECDEPTDNEASTTPPPAYSSSGKDVTEAARLVINESWFKICPRKDGKCLPKGSAAGKKALAKAAGKEKAPAKAPKEKTAKEKVPAKASKSTTPKTIAGEPVTPPSTKTVSLADTIPKGGKVAAAARVGVKGDQVPTPPPIPRLPNLTKSERKVEREFAKAYEKNPEKMVERLTKLIKKATKPGDPPTFGTDDAKVMHPAWGGKKLTLEQRSVNRATLNNALHATANAVTKKAFLKHLDTLKKGDEVLVTVGGCGAGKGFALKNVPKALEMKKKAKAVWDSAGDQNATENPWIQKELEKRGLKGNYVFVDADPKTQWAHPERGVVKRAQDPNDGRMVDAKVFADSYAHGAKNHQAFYEANKSNKKANFIFLENGATPKEIPGIPKKRLRQSAKKLADFSIETIARDASIPPHVRRGATSGTRIWPEGLTANYGLVEAMIQNAKGMEQEFDDDDEYQESLDRLNKMGDYAAKSGAQVESDHEPMELDEDGVEITEDDEEPTSNELSFSEITPHLEKALGIRFPGCYVNEVYKDHVIFRYAGNLYEVGYYTDDETDEIEISSEMPTVVRRVTTYKPVQLSSTISVTNTEAAKLILNVGKKGWTDEARAKAAATRKRKKAVKTSQAAIDKHFTEAYRDNSKQKETRAVELQTGQHFISSSGKIHRVTGVSKRGGIVDVNSVVVRESRGGDGRGGIAWTKPFGHQTSPNGEVRSQGTGFADSKYRVIESPTTNVFSDEARAAALLARKKMGEAAGAVGKAGKAAVVSGVKAAGGAAKAGLKRTGTAYKEVFKAMLEKIKTKLGIKSKGKPVKMAKDKSGAAKASKTRSSARLKKLDSKIKSNKEAVLKKKADRKAAKAAKSSVRAKVKAVTKQGKANKRAKQVAAFQSKKASTAVARSKASRASKNAAVKSKVASAKSAQESKSARYQKDGGATKAGKRLTQKDLDTQKAKTKAAVDRLTGGKASLSKSKEKLDLLNKIEKVNAATSKKEKAWKLA